MNAARRANQTLAAPTVSAEEYDADYYLTCCAGHEEWAESGGTGGAYIFQAALERSGMRPGMTVCDVGAGRGELVAAAAERGARWAVGVEYAVAAAALSGETIATRQVGDRAIVVLADARQLPLPDESVDRVYMLDVIEHLAPTELIAALREAHRVLKPGGRLFGHTMPTSTIYQVTYRAMRLAWRAAGRRWPADPRREAERRMHVNEQTRSRLRLSLRKAGFRGAHVSFGQWVHDDFIPSQKGRAIFGALARRRITASLAVSDLWLDATK